MKVINEPVEEVKAGDRVKSFDFPGVYDCYVVGTVESIGKFNFNDCEHYKIKVEKYVLDGSDYYSDKHPGIPDYVYPPKNGVPKSTGGVCNGVKVIK